VLKRVIKKRPDESLYYMVLTCIYDGQVRSSKSKGIETKLSTNKTSGNARICVSLWDDET
jgi:hypothetical protein